MTAVATQCLIARLCVLDPDLWWHLKVGDWILQHRAVPHTGILSYSAANRPWIAYSWGYEVLLSKAYGIFGFMGIAWFGVGLTIAVAIAVFWGLRRTISSFWKAWLIAAPTLGAFLFSLMPRPVFFSMILYTIMLTLLLQAQRENRIKLLYVLPLLFGLWANLHIQFIYGLFTFGLFVAAHVLKTLVSSRKIANGFTFTTTLSVRPLLAILGCCVLASCIGPYSYHLFQVVADYGNAKFSYSIIIELQALSFKVWEQYVEALLALTAFFAIGWKKKLDPFALLLLSFASVCAFRTWRDAWYLCVTAALVIADTFAEESTPSDQEEIVPAGRRMVEYAGVGSAVVVLTLLLAQNLSFTPRELDRAISRGYPVNALNYLRKHPLPGPIYNSFGWGGFLMWYQPQYPVAIDGRNDLYGDKMDEENYHTENGEASYAKDALLNNASFVLMKPESPLSKRLAYDDRFSVFYSDATAVIFTRKTPQQPMTSMSGQ